MISSRFFALTAVAFVASGLALAPAALATTADVVRAETAAGPHGKSHAGGKHARKGGKAGKANKGGKHTKAKHGHAVKKGKTTAPVDAPAEPVSPTEVIR